MIKQGEGKTRYSDAELEEFKSIITDKLDHALEELNFHKGQMGGSAKRKVKGLDDAQSSMETETTSTLAARQEKYIKHLKNALIRIENKSYGRCRETGELINKNRLKAVPHATLSIAAKKAKNRN